MGVVVVVPSWSVVEPAIHEFLSSSSARRGWSAFADHDVGGAYHDV
jgi:hypothetical protein